MLAANFFKESLPCILVSRNTDIQSASIITELRKPQCLCSLKTRNPKLYLTYTRACIPAISHASIFVNPKHLLNVINERMLPIVGWSDLGKNVRYVGFVEGRKSETFTAEVFERRANKIKLLAV